MSDDAPRDQDGRRRVELKLDVETAKGRYANATVVTQGRHEVVLDFIAALPHHRPQVVARVVLPRAQAQALAATLQRTLASPPPAAGAAPVDRDPDDDPN